MTTSGQPISSKSSEKAIQTMNLPFEVTDVFWMTVKVWDKYNTIIHQGGTSSSKTYSILQWLILVAMQRANTRITVVGQDVPNLRVGAYADIQTIIASSEVVKSYIISHHKGIRTFTFSNGSIIEFNSYSDAQDAKSGKRDIAFFNELNGIDPDVYSEIADRTTLKVLADYNPTARFWAHTELIGQEGVVLLISNYKHNRFCAKNIIRKLLSYRKTNPHRWRVYGLGLTGVTEGTIFPNVEFRAPSLYPDPMDMRKFGYGMDYGFSNDPTTLVRCGLYQGQIHTQLLIYKTALTRRQIVRQMEEWNVDPYDLISMDDSQAKEQAFLLKTHDGYNIKSANRRGGSIMSGLKLLLEYPIVIYDDEEGNFKTEQENYKFKKVQGVWTDQPIDKHNHAIDALRYWALEFLSELDYGPYKGNYKTI